MDYVAYMKTKPGWHEAYSHLVDVLKRQKREMECGRMTFCKQGYQHPKETVPDRILARIAWHAYNSGRTADIDHVLMMDPFMPGQFMYYYVPPMGVFDLDGELLPNRSTENSERDPDYRRARIHIKAYLDLRKNLSKRVPGDLIEALASRISWAYEYGGIVRDPRIINVLLVKTANRFYLYNDGTEAKHGAHMVLRAKEAMRTLDRALGKSKPEDDESIDD